MLRITTTLLAAVASVSAGIIPKQGPSTCNDYNALIPIGGLSVAATFCRQQVIAPVYTTATALQTNVKVVTSAVTSLKTAIITPLPIQVTSTSYTTKTVTVTPVPTTVRITQTGTAYVDGQGHTISVALPAAKPKRDLGEDEDALEERGLSLPIFWVGLSQPQLLAACTCLGISGPTYTAQATQTINLLSTVVQFVTGTVLQTLPAVTNVIPEVDVLGVTIQAAAPVSTILSTVYKTVASCPPATKSTFICPAGCGRNDGLLGALSQLACPVVAKDKYSGECAYWALDGSPVGSMFTYKSPVTGLISIRAAIYGNTPSADCPSWSDYTCAPGANHQRDFIPELVERAHAAKAIPKGLTRGGQYVPYDTAVARGSI